MSARTRTKCDPPNAVVPKKIELISKSIWNQSVSNEQRTTNNEHEQVIIIIIIIIINEVRPNHLPPRHAPEELKSDFRESSDPRPHHRNWSDASPDAGPAARGVRSGAQTAAASACQQRRRARPDDVEARAEHGNQPLQPQARVHEEKAGAPVMPDAARQNWPKPGTTETAGRHPEPRHAAPHVHLHPGADGTDSVWHLRLPQARLKIWKGR